MVIYNECFLTFEEDSNDYIVDEWKFVDAGTNMSDMIRFNFFAGTSGSFCVAIIDESTDGARDAEIDGYITFVQEHPLAT